MRGRYVFATLTFLVLCGQPAFTAQPPQPPQDLQVVGELVVIDSHDSVVGTVRQWVGDIPIPDPVVTFGIGARYFQAVVHRDRLEFHNSAVYFESPDCTGTPLIFEGYDYDHGTFARSMLVAVAGVRQTVYIGDNTTARLRQVFSGISDGDDECWSSSWTAPMAEATATHVSFADLYTAPFRLQATRVKTNP